MRFLKGMKAALLFPVCFGWLVFEGHAQVITNNGASIFVAGGAVLTVKGGFKNSNSGATVENNGTIQLTGDWQQANSAQYAGTGTLELNGTSVQQISGTTVHNLEVNNAAGATQLENLTVTGALTFTSGNLTATAGKTLVLEGNITEKKDRLYEGELTKVVSVGPATASQHFGNIGVTLQNPNGGDWGEVTISRITGALGAIANPNNPNVQGIKRHWYIGSQFTPTGKKIDITLRWLTNENNGLAFAENLAQVWKSEDNGATWLPVGSQVPITFSQDGDLQSVTVQTGSSAMWTVSDVSAPLPVTWLSFEGRATAAGNELSWSTASEINSASFLIQRAVNAKDFTDLGEVAAAGTSAQHQKYNFLDNTASAEQGTLYYRLRQIDLDGKFEYSKVLAIERKGHPAALKISVFPNPFMPGQSLTVNFNKTGMAARFRLYDLLGKTLYSTQAEVEDGKVILNGLPELADGLYLLEVTAEGKPQVIKLKKQ